MKPISKGILAAAAAVVALGLPSCSDENPWSGSQGVGGIKLTLAASPDYVDGAPVTRAPESLFNVPDAADFSIKLEKLDGSYSKEWNSLSDFENEDGFPAGAYTLTATYGSLEDEGFEKPHFSGSEALTVLEERETAVNIEAILANTMVSVDYTDAFKDYFASWSSEVHSEGHAYNAVAGDETRPVFVAPGTVDVSVDFTDRQNRNAKVQAASFEALPRHHYHLTIDVNNGNVGTAQIVISFDDTVEEENVYIDLTDELFSSPAPTLTAEGFTSGESFDLLQGAPLTAALKLQAMARAGMSSAILTVASETFTPAFGKEVNLCNASPALQEQLRSLGITAVGFFKNPGVFGNVDLSGLASALPVGSHTVSLLIKDKFNRVSDPVSVTFNIEAPNLNLSVEPSVLGSEEAVFNLSFNGEDPASRMKFTVMDDLGGYVEAPIIKSEKVSSSRALAVQNYRLTVKLPAVERNPIPAKAYFDGNEVGQYEIRVVVPSYTYEVDPFATKALIKVNADDPSLQSAVANSVRPLISGANAGSVTFSRNASTGVITLNGLSAASDYTLTLVLGGDKKNAGSFTTEAALAIPNGDFSTTSQLTVSSLQVGGAYRVSPVDYTIKSSISRDVPEGWATLNDLTCYAGSTNKNTWFMVPSTYVENGAALIRSVGYSHNGTTPDRSGGTFNIKYYCENAPASLDRSAGELFLGSYVFDTRVDGTPFASRPSGLSFDYKYAPYGSETGEVYVAVKDASGKVIASKTESLGSASQMTAKTLSLPAYDFGTKAARIEVRFRSTSGSEVGLTIPSGTALNEGTGLGNKTKGANDYKAFAHGSELTVDNVKLNY